MGCVYSPPPSIVHVTPSNPQALDSPPPLEAFFKAPLLMEINSVPPPFDVAGNFPYVLWINGQRVPYAPVQELRAVVNKVGEENIKEIDMADIHKGWLSPHYGPPSQDIPQAQGRTRTLTP